MSEMREFNASTVEDALEKAVSTLAVGKQDLSYEVVDEGSSGFLGLGARDARIKVKSTAVNTELPSSQNTAAPSEAPATPVTEDSPGDTETDSVDAPEGGLDPEPVEDEVDAERLATEVRDHVEIIIDAMAFDGEVSVHNSDEVVHVNIESEDAGLLIGQKGETIDAIQYLVNVSLYRNHQSPKKVILDCGGYRERRVNAVQGMAHRTAKRVSREGKAIDLPPMSSSERRAVHSYLKENPRVTTSSTGEDENRRVTVTPS